MVGAASKSVTRAVKLCKTEFSKQATRGLLMDMKLFHGASGFEIGRSDFLKAGFSASVIFTAQAKALPQVSGNLRASFQVAAFGEKTDSVETEAEPFVASTACTCRHRR